MCKMMLKILVLLYFIFFSNSIFSKEIPIIVISAGKTVQSYSSVGSQVTVIDSKSWISGFLKAYEVVFFMLILINFQLNCLRIFFIIFSHCQLRFFSFFKSHFYIIALYIILISLID